MQEELNTCQGKSHNAMFKWQNNQLIILSSRFRIQTPPGEKKTYDVIVFEVVVGQAHAVESRRVPRELSGNGSKNYSDFGVGNFDVRILVRIEPG
jgi:hypothetical protein